MTIPRRSHSAGLKHCLLPVTVLLCASCGLMEESDYSNCVVASDAAAYIGERLLHYDGARSQRLLTTEYFAEHQRIDGGDGNDAGRVRWVVCFNGPDCDVAGMF